MDNKKFFLFIIVLLCSHLLYISFVNKYTYPFIAQDDQGLFQRLSYNIFFYKKFSGSLVDKKFFCVVRSPLYPFIISISYLLNIKPIFFIRFFQLILSIITLFLIYNITDKILGNKENKIKYLTLVIACLDPHFVSTIYLILSENISIFLLISIIFCIQKNYIYLLGIFSGLLILNRPIFIPYIITQLILLFFFKKIKVIHILNAILTIIIVILPWLYVNKIEINKLIVSRAAGTGFNLFQNLYMILDNKEKNKILNLHHDSIKLYLKSWSLAPPPPFKVINADHNLKNFTINYIFSHKRIILKMFLVNLKKVFFDKYNPFIYSNPSYYYFLFSEFLRYFFFINFITYSFFNIFKTKNITHYSVIILFIILILTHCIGHSEPRYYIYIYPFMYIYSSYILYKLYNSIKLLLKL